MASPYRDVAIPIKAWLRTITLPGYLPFFSKFNDAKELFEVTEQELLKLGIQNSEHRTQIIKSLRLLAERCQAKNAPPANQVKKAPTTGQSDSEKRLSAELSDELRLLSDLRGVAWFHGKITREVAEQLVKEDGEFLVRESISQSGSCVLTCNHQGQLLHFVINKFSESSPRGGSKSVEYGFENSRFSSIQALILSHVADRSVITSASQAKIRTPLNRTVPLSAAAAGGDHSLIKTSSRDSPIYEPTSPSSRVFRQSNNQSPSSSAASPKLLVKRDNNLLSRVSSEPRLHKEDLTPASAVTGRFVKRANNKLSTSSLALPPSMNTSRAQSEGELNVTPSPLPNRSAELKTSRNATSRGPPVVAIRNRELYDDGADYSDYFEVKRMPDNIPTSNNVPGVSDTYQSNGELQNLNQSNGRAHLPTQSVPNQNSSVVNEQDDVGGEDYDVPAPEVREIHQFTTPIIPTNYIDAYNFKSKLLSNQNKPLDPTCMYKMKQVLFQGNHLQISEHITHLDLHLFKVIETRNLGAGIFSGLEALTLPQGRHFRQAAIERHCCLSFVVSVTILACTDDLIERSQMVKQWLLIAKDLLRAHGNLLSFAAIMNGLCAQPVQRLMMTWNILERGDPVLINHWRTQLRPAYRNLTVSANSLSSDNISIPYLVPICELLEDEQTSDQLVDADYLVNSLAQMDLARLMAGQTSNYSRKGVNILKFFSPEPEITDLCKVELHMRLLFGHRGSLAKQSERKSKFKKILNILSVKAESDDLGTEF